MHHGCRVVVAAIATLAATLAVAQSAAGAIVASPSSLTFPDTAVGAESTLAVTFTNTDPTASYLSVFSTSPVGGDFTLGSTDCPFPLPGGATCQYTIRFTPSSVGMKSGTFSWATTNRVGGLGRAVGRRGDAPDRQLRAGAGVSGSADR